MTPRSIFLVLSLVATAASWSLHAPPNNNKSKRSTLAALDASLSNRRSFLSRTTAAVATSSLLQITTYPKLASAAAALSQDAALAQWKASVTTIDNLLENWDTITKGGGDAIRKELGTANFGTDTSPLFQIDKAFKVLRENDDVDLIEFTEQSEEFSNVLAQADTMAYSANFAGGSGKPTPPKVYIDKSKKEVEGLQKIAKSLSSLL
mmetsp:Transcript_27045/g.56338  ORF Transcript_27045/g.56338 Transcript_27045/m.56338 type:complete len:207 (-) Transcript_27045:400-1020(-)